MEYVRRLSRNLYQCADFQQEKTLVSSCCSNSAPDGGWADCARGSTHRSSESSRDGRWCMCSPASHLPGWIVASYPSACETQCGRGIGLCCVRVFKFPFHGQEDAPKTKNSICLELPGQHFPWAGILHTICRSFIARAGVIGCWTVVA